MKLLDRIEYLGLALYILVILSCMIAIPVIVILTVIHPPF